MPIRVSEEGVALVGTGPLRRRIGCGDELRLYLARRAPRLFIQRVEVLLNRAPGRCQGLPVRLFRSRYRALLVGIRRDQARIHRKPFAADQAFLDRPPHHHLKELAEQIALAEAAMMGTS